MKIFWLRNLKMLVLEVQVWNHQIRCAPLTRVPPTLKRSTLFGTITRTWGPSNNLLSSPLDRGEIPSKAEPPWRMLENLEWVVMLSMRRNTMMILIFWLKKMETHPKELLWRHEEKVSCYSTLMTTSTTTSSESSRGLVASPTYPQRIILTAIICSYPIKVLRKVLQVRNFKDRVCSPHWKRIHLRGFLNPFRQEIWGNRRLNRAVLRATTTRCVKLKEFSVVKIEEL